MQENLGTELNIGYHQKAIFDGRACSLKRRSRRSDGLPPHPESPMGVKARHYMKKEIIEVHQGTERSNVSPQGIWRSDVSPQDIGKKGMITFLK